VEFICPVSVRIIYFSFLTKNTIIWNAGG